MKFYSLFLLCACLFCATTAEALNTGAQEDVGVTLELKDQPAYNNQEQVLQVHDRVGNPIVGVWVHARYYPRTTIRRGELVCRTDANGACTWTPQYAGLVEMRVLQERPELTKNGILVSETARETPMAKRTFSIRFEHVPMSGVAIFILAFVMLFGALTWSMTELLVLAPKRQAKADAAAAEASNG